MNHNDLMKIIHNKTPLYTSLFILVKFQFTSNIFFHILSFFFRFVGILILCANFSLKINELQNKSLSYYLRYLTSQKLLDLIGITNKLYIIISIIIFIILCLRIIGYILIMSRLKYKKHESTCFLIVCKIINFFEHLVYLLYPFILEFSAQIIFSYIFPDTFIFIKDQSKILNVICAIINLIMIIFYNINNFFHMIIVNKPYDEKNTAIKYRYSSGKFWIIFLMQNISLIQNIPLYFSTDAQI